MTSTPSPLDLRPVATLDEKTRGDFMIRVYQHLMGAIAIFVAIEAVLFATGLSERIYDTLAGSGGTWLLVIGGFMVLQMVAAKSAADLLNPSKQYMGLFLMAAGYAVLFAVPLYYAFNSSDTGGTTVTAAAGITGFMFAGLSAIGIFTRKDLSFVRPLVMWGSFAALGLIVGAILFGWNLGVWFSVAMIALSGASILYTTQNILRRYPQDAHVAAALALFSSVMTMFWYVLRLFNNR